LTIDFNVLIGERMTRLRKRLAAKMKSARATAKMVLGSDKKWYTTSVQFVQKVFALRKGISSAGTPYKKGDPILQLSSTRRTGETFVLTDKDLNMFMKFKTQKYRPLKRARKVLYKNSVNHTVDRELADG